MGGHRRPESEVSRERSDASIRQGNEASNRAIDDVVDAWRSYGNGIGQRIDSARQGVSEFTQRQIDSANRTAQAAGQWVNEQERRAGEWADTTQRQLSNLPSDTIVRARHDWRATEAALDARERQLYPQEHRPNQSGVARTPEANRLAPRVEAARPAHVDAPHPTAERPPHTDAAHPTAARPAEAPHTAARPAHTVAPHTAARLPHTDAAPAARRVEAPANHDYVVRRGDTLSEIVHRDEERHHPGRAHNMRQEAIRVAALRSHMTGEVLLPGMHIDLG